jgi:hypothetical protein
MPAASITLDQALNLARTGDGWLFRGRAMAGRAMQVATNSPVNHVGMSVALEDLPPLLWHAELAHPFPPICIRNRSVLIVRQMAQEWQICAWQVTGVPLPFHCHA